MQGRLDWFASSRAACHISVKATFPKGTGGLGLIQRELSRQQLPASGPPGTHQCNIALLPNAPLPTCQNLVAADVGEKQVDRSTVGARHSITMHTTG